MRKFARELGVDVARVKGSGPKGRIQQEDVQNFVKQVMKAGQPAAPPLPPPLRCGGPGRPFLFASGNPQKRIPAARIPACGGRSLKASASPPQLP